ncbi:MAG TPA: hypothetical protein VNX21_00695 [Candidatus Thermoplasmatota archaeon]|nr:hypothetical protein [Candidatus Thermoplasmatota archaeon]
MSRTVTLLAVLLASAALAGCTLNRGDDGNGTTTTTTTATTTTPPTGGTTTTPPTQDTNQSTPLSNSSFSVATSGVPAQVLPGQRFNFTLFVNGTANATSDHIGAHYADNATTSPNATGMKSCEHQAGRLPGEYTVACRVDETGTWYVYGHARANDTGGQFDWWATPVAVKARNYTLNLTGAPTTPPLGNSSFTLSLGITGSDNATSDHIGAHWFNATTPTPTVATSGGACAHASGNVVNTHAVECRIPNSGPAPKAYYVYGHLRITEGGVTLEWWSAPVEVTIGPNLPLGG